MQSRAHTLAPAGDPQALAYLELLASDGPVRPAPDPEAAYLALLASDGPLSPVTDPAAAYQALLASDGPLTPAADPAGAYQALLASDGPLTPAAEYQALLASDAPLVSTAVRGRPRTSHRTATRPVAFALLGERGRTAVLAAALMAGAGVAGVTAADAAASNSHAQAVQTRTATHTALAAPAPRIASGQTGVASADELEPADTAPALSFTRGARKTRPVPVVQWVNPLPEAGVTSCFGQRWGRLHAGVDLATAEGTRIRAVGAGRVVAAGPADGYGNAVLIDHGNGYLTHYGHMLDITVTVGQQVTAGTEIGHEGSTGHSTGPHLHFEVHQGTYKNPIEPTRWLHEHGVEIPGCTTFTTDPEMETP